MLIWDKDIRKDQAGNVASESYTAQVPYWGEASVRSRAHHPGEMFLDCLALGIDTLPLGRVEPIDALDPAEAVLLRTLKEHGIWCLEAMAAIGSAEN